MKSLTTTIFLLCAFSLLLLSCSLTENSKKEKCPESFDYGSVNICLPSIDSMKNYYADTTIKKMADRLETPTNSIKAFYLTDTVYHMVKETGLLVNDNFLKITTINDLADTKSDSAYLEQVSNSIQTNNPFHDWNEIRMKLETGMDFITPGHTIYVDKYSPAPAVRSFVMLLKYRNGTQDELLMGILNIMLIKERLIGMNFYKLYRGAETLDQARTKNDAIVRRMMDTN